MLRHYFLSTTVQSVHSPYLYSFLKKTIEDKTQPLELLQLQSERKHILNDHTLIDGISAGEPSKMLSHTDQTIANIAKTAASQRWKAEWLFKMVKHLKPKKILELGTSIGLTTKYLATGSTDVAVTTVEGNKSIYNYSIERFQTWDNINAVLDSFSTFLTSTDFSSTTWDFVFMDGDHNGEHVSQYFHLLLHCLSPSAVVILDDIHWSHDMNLVWQQLKAAPSVTASIDVYQFGILFFEPDLLQKTHLRIVPKWMKPWKISF